jgi:putative flavoprotein involved in K+ transport
MFVSQTMERPDTRSQAAVRADAWLAEFEQALTANDVERAASMFLDSSYWRDIVAFTWNITTVEGPDGVADMLRQTLESTQPSGFRTAEEPAEADGVIEAFLEFETRVGRGSGHLRLKDG